ncbi:MAG: hypothetical protein ACYCZB_17790 [Acidiphilium sp.]
MDIRIKRGATLSLTATFANADGTAFDLTKVTLSGSVADARGNLIAPLAVVAGATPGMATIAVGSTAAWPEGLLEADIVVTAPAGVAISQSFGIRVERPVTQLAPDPAPYNPVLAP